MKEGASTLAAKASELSERLHIKEKAQEVSEKLQLKERMQKVSESIAKLQEQPVGTDDWLDG